jgi:cyclopropane-fatty-acyl-phospholipid synthase
MTIERALHPANTGTGPANALDRWLLRSMMAALPGAGYEVVLWDGSCAGDKTGMQVRIFDRGALWRVVRNPALEFGDLYAAGRIEVDGDLVTFLERTYAALDAGRAARTSAWWNLWTDAAQHSRTVAAARDNIQQHYDLGNDFYALWLDRASMQYTCAYFPEAGMTLEAAQRAKMDHICRKLRLRPGQTVFEAGCGWGGFALHMAREYGVRVRAWNISHEQVRHATERARAQGLGDRVTYVEDDYRNIRGGCDAFVSVGMLEHVGPENYGELGRVIGRCLAPQGLGLIHTIGRNRPEAMNGWIERRIFPGAQPPSLGEMMAIFEPAGLSVLDVENLRLHYAETLRHWYERVQRNRDQIVALYDERFFRMWSMYLASCEMGFRYQGLMVLQVQLAKRVDAVPLTRDYMFEWERSRGHAQQIAAE